MRALKVMEDGTVRVGHRKIEKGAGISTKTWDEACWEWVGDDDHTYDPDDTTILEDDLPTCEMEDEDLGIGPDMWEWYDESIDQGDKCCKYEWIGYGTTAIGMAAAGGGVKIACTWPLNGACAVALGAFLAAWGAYEVAQHFYDDCVEKARIREDCSVRGISGIAN